jgi:hypothetical protein
MVSCSQSAPHPPLNDNPSDEIEIIGTIPETVAIEFAAVYQTTVVNDKCAPTPTWLSGIPSPKQITVPVHLDSRVKNQGTWIAWRDLLVPGQCGWRFRGIEYKADRTPSDFQAHKQFLITNFIADACLKDNVWHVDCPAGTVNFNDAESVPVHHYCKFSVLRDQKNGVANPCAFESDGKISPMQPVKHLHLLRPQQRTVRFTLTDLES